MSKVPPIAALAFAAAIGCGQQAAPVATTPPTPVAAAHDHSGWWCDEHGVKEAECSLCNAKVAKAFQDKGDWCPEHTRARSQCYICDPKLRDKYAAEYRAKTGEDMPEPTGQKAN